MFRPYQRINVTFHEKEQALFPGPNRLRQKTKNHHVRLGTGRLFYLTTEDDQRLSQERLYRHEFGFASSKVRQRPKP
jgi:hypothetical protein